MCAVCLFMCVCVACVVFFVCMCGVCLYTGCPRRKGPNFRRVFLRSNYTDMTQNTYIRNSIVTEILGSEKFGRLWCLRTVVRP